LITCNLTKLESALDQIRKVYPKLVPADAALIASALSVTGRHALAIHGGRSYIWPDHYDDLCRALVGELEVAHEQSESATKKAAKAAAAEEEPVVVRVGLRPNVEAGERVLEGRDELKALLSDILQEGVEFTYTSTDIGWQWALDRVNWSTVSGGELSRRIKIKVEFVEGAVGVESGTGAKKSRATKAKASEPLEQPVEA
jgi:hypothetical protein